MEGRATSGENAESVLMIMFSNEAFKRKWSPIAESQVWVGLGVDNNRR